MTKTKSESRLTIMLTKEHKDRLKVLAMNSNMSMGAYVKMKLLTNN
jgi:hypothetical protein